MIDDLSEMIKLYESGKLDKIKMKDAPLSINLIPNSDRIIIEKQLVEALKGGKKVKREDIKELSSLPVVSKYFECIFGLKDMYLFRAVAKSYLGLYKEAILDFV